MFSAAPTREVHMEKVLFMRTVYTLPIKVTKELNTVAPVRIGIYSQAGR